MLTDEKIYEVLEFPYIINVDVVQVIKVQGSHSRIYFGIAAWVKNNTMRIQSLHTEQSERVF